MKPVVPALIPRSAEEVITVLSDISFSPEVHLDVVDGKFVPFVSWPYAPVGQAREVSSMTDRFTLEVDLMVEDPLRAAREWLQAGADMLVFHVETISLHEFTTLVEQVKQSVAISALNDTPLDTLLSYAAVADSVQLMGIKEIGAQGQPFDERVIERIQLVKQRFPRKPITIDGSVNEATISRLAKAGADRFICGSAIIKAAEPRVAYDALRALTY